MRRDIVLRLLIVGVALGAFFWQPTPVAPKSVRFASGTVRLGDQELQVRIPRTTQASEQGLSGVTKLSDTEGMWWSFPEPQQPTFWMHGMKIGLDFIWVRDGKVVEMTQKVPPPTTTTLTLYRPAEPVTDVLEVASGFIERHHITKGTIVDAAE